MDKLTTFFLTALLSFYSVGTLADTDSKNAHKDGNILINDDDPRPKIRLGFTAVSSIHRQLLLTVDENATAGIDWGYDGEYYETEWEDMYWLLEGERFTIQGTNELNESTVLLLGYHTHSPGMNTIMIDQLENFYDHLNIYIHDKEEDVYQSLREGDYRFYSEAGVYMDRFELVFSLPETLGLPTNELDSFEFFYSNAEERVVVKNPQNKQIKQVSLYNMLGQSVFNVNSMTTFGDLKYNVPNLSTGTYIILLNTEHGVLSKKVLVK